MKKKRHELILKLVQSFEITTQEELMQLLNQHGFQVTQATVSRDIKELQLVKTPAKNGPTKYTVSSTTAQDGKEDKVYNLFSQSVVTVDFAGNICVIKCYSGTANAAGAAVDAMHLSEVVGSLAGDDTLFVLCRDTQSAQAFKERIEIMLNGDA